MIASPEPRYFTPEEYLEWEAQQPLRYEYVGGEVFAMTGGTVTHNTIALNLAATLRGHVRGGPCRVFMADVKVQRLCIAMEKFWSLRLETLLVQASSDCLN